jgi:putative membrane protein
VTKTSKLKIAAISIAVLLVLIVILQNTEPIETQILFASLKMPAAALLFGTLMIGFGLGVLTAARISRRRDK